MDMFQRRGKRPKASLNLAAIMDIFSVLIIFFVKSNATSESAVEVPKDIHVPKSISSESVDTAPEVFLLKDEVDMKLINRRVKLEDLRKTQGKLNERGQYVYIELKKYIEGLREDTRDFGLTINFISDRGANYKNVYDVVEFLKQVGFKNILFIAEVSDK